MFLDSLLNPDKPGIAIDIGSRFIKAVSLKKVSNKIQIINYAIEDLGKSIEDVLTQTNKNQPISEEFKESIITTINNLIKKVGGSGKNVITSVNSRFLVTRIVNIMGEEGTPEFNSSLNAALEEQFANYKKDTIRKSYAVIRKGSGEVPNTVIIAAAKIEAVSFLEEIITRAGYRLTVLDGVPFALYNIFEFIMNNDEEIRELPPENKNFILVDIGYNNLNILGIKNGFLEKISSSFNFNDRYIIDGLINNEGKDFKEAYKTKFELFKKTISGSEQEKMTLKNQVLGTYYNYFGSQLKNILINQITEMLSSMDLSPAALNKIVLSGGGAFFPYILEFISSKIGDSENSVKTELLNPFYGMSSKINNEDIAINALYAVATGLALRTI